MCKSMIKGTTPSTFQHITSHFPTRVKHQSQVIEKSTRYILPLVRKKLMNHRSLNYVTIFASEEKRSMNTDNTNSRQTFNNFFYKN